MDNSEELEWMAHHHSQLAAAMSADDNLLSSLMGTAIAQELRSQWASPLSRMG